MNGSILDNSRTILSVFNCPTNLLNVVNFDSKIASILTKIISYAGRILCFVVRLFENFFETAKSLDCFEKSSSSPQYFEIKEESFFESTSSLVFKWSLEKTRVL